MELATLDDLHVITERLYRMTADLPPKRKKEEICDAIEELLVLAYVFGVDRVDSQVPYDVPRMYEAIYLPIAGETFEQRVERHISEGSLDLPALQKIVDTDYHRVEETGAFDTAKWIEANGRPVTPTDEEIMLGIKDGHPIHMTEEGIFTERVNVFKKWRTMKDDRVRETHWYIDDWEVPMDGTFVTIDGDTARFPGDFSLPENNVNCRCTLHYVFR